MPLPDRHACGKNTTRQVNPTAATAATAAACISVSGVGDDDISLLLMTWSACSAHLSSSTTEPTGCVTASHAASRNEHDDDDADEERRTDATWRQFDRFQLVRFTGYLHCSFFIVSHKCSFSSATWRHFEFDRFHMVKKNVVIAELSF